MIVTIKIYLISQHNQLTTSFPRPCYCTVHMYAVVHFFCDILWFFLVKAKLCRFCLFDYIYYYWRYNYQEILDPINWFNAAPFCVRLKQGPGFPSVDVVDRICVCSLLLIFVELLITTVYTFFSQQIMHDLSKVRLSRIW